MASSVPLQIAETIQTAHINRDPSPQHDINPSTAASKKEPVSAFLEDSAHSFVMDDGGIDENDVDDEVDEYDEYDDDIPYRGVLSRKPRGAQLPPIPDLRYEQSYLHSIRTADTWWKVVWITTRDQVMMPFAQGILYNLAICGWQYWNRTAQISGSSLGARVRRWWYGVNNWPIPGEKTFNSIRR
ncbi:hypothetical protein B0T17DRAFT_493867 [Bombardia bombarda]|uniref:DUF1770-domain-containing protein n=1 Tax=Bombardia bombarda TaxID=252184 RepID=A0AA40C107_9PEZI|nr:hypothetical protein B0T17DRAFT_493867 [Bombardia bombarda]